MEQDTKIKILVVEDDISLKDSLVRLLQNRDFLVQAVENKQQAVEQIKSGQQYDIYLLDVWLPDGNGFDICHEIRKISQAIVMFLTSCDDEESITKGLDIGGDDYIMKPFSMDELDARILAHLRREKRLASREQLQFQGKLVINYSQRKVFYDSVQIPFTRMEFDLIEFLSMHKKQVFSKERIYEAVRGYDGEGDSSIIMEHIRRIRQKLKKYTKHDYIETVWGVGYQWIG